MVFFLLIILFSNSSVLGQIDSIHNINLDTVDKPLAPDPGNPPISLPDPLPDIGGVTES